MRTVVCGTIVDEDNVETFRRQKRELLDEAKARNALLVEISRQVTRIRRDLGKLTREQVDAALKKTVALTFKPWPRQIACEICGAPVTQLRAERKSAREGGSFMVTEHPGGASCRERLNDVVVRMLPS